MGKARREPEDDGAQAASTPDELFASSLPPVSSNLASLPLLTPTATR